ncbi:hypothetical protein [Caballeronia sordidicola]|uniref:hypothetical protein n=1 Tax=Caballeronia sordidicola TaxID=196367 RepID=UPI000A37D7FC|nr:hypothetical protein [Caballeronia sordidicola]
MKFEDWAFRGFVVLLLIAGAQWAYQNLPWYVLAFIVFFLFAMHHDYERRRNQRRADLEYKNRVLWEAMEAEQERQKWITLAREAVKNKENK